VSPLGLQEGAQRVADTESIHEVTLNADATEEKYRMTFRQYTRIRDIETVHAPNDQLVCATLTREDGTVESLDIGE
ncbi:MAG: hypothetical protein KC457_19905, partial [Myxococcales bacterium]|nr:hypothetical protein [Myxococcales bacterium]